MSLGIVVLNYMNYRDTISCVDAFAFQHYDNYQVAIIDNHSPNNSFTVLKDHFKDVNKVDIIETTENLGFARGNNVGINHLRRQGFDRIFVVNPDTLLSNQHYFKYLATTNFPPNVGMVGTTIVNLQMQEQNPVRVSHKPPSSLLDKIKDDYSFCRMQYLPSIPVLTSLKTAIKNSLYIKNLRKTQHTTHGSRVLDPAHEMLHGSAILFTETFLERYHGFCPETFMFMEEDILALLCQKTAMRQYFTSTLSITHKEDGSSNIAWSQGNKDQIKYQYVKESAKIVREIQRMDPGDMSKLFATKSKSTTV